MEYIQQRLEKHGLKVKAIKLNHGDFFLIENGAYVERKITSDLLRSIRDLGSRMAKLKELSPFPTLLIEGELRYNRFNGRILRREGKTFFETAWKVDSYNSFVLSLIMKGIIVLQTSSLDHSIDMIASMTRYLAKPTHLPLFEAHDLYLSCLRCFPGVGEDLAVRIMRRFSLKEIVNEPERLAELEGIGKKKVEKIKEFLERKNDGS